MLAIRFPWDSEPPGRSPAGVAGPAHAAAGREPRGRRPIAVIQAKSQQSSTAVDWVYHHLTFSGPADMVDDFAHAARGAGVVPWQPDLAALEEEVFVRTVSQPANQRSLTVAGRRILA